ncbi:MAG: ABC transporter ATP-binding protein/permease [Sterolibacterium sp.]|nr:ABC transporter ATP-binding protein/permease [Sterolibacterium sp.]
MDFDSTRWQTQPSSIRQCQEIILSACQPTPQTHEATVLRHRPSAVLPGTPLAKTHSWQTIRTLLPYLLEWKWRVGLAMLCLIVAKLANVAVPLVFKEIIDALTPAGGNGQTVLIVPAALVLAYGLLRLSTSLFTELRELVFARVTQRAVRTIALQVFRHLHALSLRFHLERQTGGLTRDIERGTRAIGSLISYTLYSILPTFVEISLVIGVLLVRYDIEFAAITLITVLAYITFTVSITNWRTLLRRQANELDSAANSQAIDSLLNYETVKYFNNEHYEAQRYDAKMAQWETAQVKNQLSLSLLNSGQALITATGVALLMWRAAVGVASGSMTIGDIVLVNAFLIQLYIPLNFLGVLYREIRQALTDIERMFLLLQQHREVQDAPDARPLPAGPCAIAFRHVDFSYEANRQILHDVDFSIPAGQTLAVVGHSGSGKSTLARLLYRFSDVATPAAQGGIRINAVDLRTLQQDSLRAAIGIVPQDTVLFNDTIHYNIRYGQPDATEEEVIAAARAAQLHEFVSSLPEGYQTRVGERGLKLSGGEKQRVAIARALLKNPPIMIFDEATSALDSHTEQAIQTQLEQIARGRTTLIIAHRLSTVMNADNILVLEQGRIIERGHHRDLLDANGTYARMWALQQQESEADTTASGVLMQ